MKVCMPKGKNGTIDSPDCTLWCLTNVFRLHGLFFGICLGRFFLETKTLFFSTNFWIVLLATVNNWLVLHHMNLIDLLSGLEWSRFSNVGFCFTFWHSNQNYWHPTFFSVFCDWVDRNTIEANISHKILTCISALMAVKSFGASNKSSKASLWIGWLCAELKFQDFARVFPNPSEILTDFFKYLTKLNWIYFQKLIKWSKLQRNI